MNRSRRAPVRPVPVRNLADAPAVNVAIAPVNVVNPNVAPNAEQLLQQFIVVLRVCGITVPAVINAITVTQGLSDISAFGDLTEELIKSMAYTINKTHRLPDEDPLVIPVYALQRLYALQQWVHWQECRGLPVDATLFDRDTLKWSLTRIKDEHGFKKETKPTPTQPDKLKNIGHAAWLPFWKQFDPYCGAIRGCLNVPLSYVYRDHVVVTVDILEAEYNDTDAELIATLLLSGANYKKDNKAVWDLLVPLVTNGHAWPFIKRFEKTCDGRGALTVLKNASEGDSSIVTRRLKAYEILKSTAYTAKSNKFTFENYCERLQFAFSELEECDEPLAETKKVETFMSNIQTDILRGALNIVLTSPDMLTDFETAKDYCMSVLSRMKSYTPQPTHRGVSAVDHKMDHKTGDLKLNYSNAEWKALPKATQDKVKQMRLDSGSSTASPAKPTSKKGFKRKIKALQKELATLTSKVAVTSSDSSEPPAKKI